jgi:hypothetical protein
MSPRCCSAPCRCGPRRRRAGPYVTGWLGKSRLIGFSGEPDKFGNRTIELYLQAVEERREDRRQLVVVADEA